MLHRENRRIGPGGTHPRHVVYGIEGAGEGFKVTMSWATAVEGGVIVTSGFMALRADFGFVAGGLGLHALRTGIGSLVLNRGVLCGIYA